MEKSGITNHIDLPRQPLLQLSQAIRHRITPHNHGINTFLQPRPMTRGNGTQPKIQSVLLHRGQCSKSKFPKFQSIRHHRPAMTQLTIRSMELTEQPISVGKVLHAFGIETLQCPSWMRRVCQGFDFGHVDPEMGKPAGPSLIAILEYH